MKEVGHWNSRSPGITSYHELAKNPQLFPIVVITTGCLTKVLTTSLTCIDPPPLPSSNSLWSATLSFNWYLNLNYVYFRRGGGTLYRLPFYFLPWIVQKVLHLMSLCRNAQSVFHLLTSASFKRFFPSFANRFSGSHRPYWVFLPFNY